LKIILFANTEWYLYNFRRSLAIALRDAAHEVLLVSPPGPYSKHLCKLGFRWIEAPMERRSLNPLRELALLLWLRRLIVREGVDVVHGFTIKCAVYGSLSGRLAGVQARVNSVVGMGYVFTSDSMKARLLRPLVRGLLRLALDGRSARLILQNADDVALFGRAHLVEKSRIRLIPGSGVDCNRFNPYAQTHRLSAAGEYMRVVLPARLLWDKGLAEFVEAAHMLRSEGRAIDFLLAGDPDPGNPAAVPVGTVQDWVDNGIVQWLGHVEDMPALFRFVDVVALPSYREGLPKGLIEAGASALALITTDVPGCREVVTDGIDGLLVPAKDGAALARAIARLHDDPALRRRLGVAAREKALTEFDERIVIRRTMAVYDELVRPERG
jgi:glycosyltransferase involved in cell wall biosynthesis